MLFTNHHIQTTQRKVKIRGLSKGNLIDKNNFIVLDRLRTTLEQEMKTWIEMEKKFKGKCFGCIARNKKGLHDLLVTRMTVAYDLASAFYYLHENRLVYRDIKVRTYANFASLLF